MTETHRALSLERFAALAEAYGAAIERWPVGERAAAQAMANGAAARAILARAQDLDRLLDSYRVPAPSSALAGRILADADRIVRRRDMARNWWAGLGLAGVGLAGALAGAMAATAVLPRVDPDLSVIADAGAWSGADEIDLDLGRDAL